MQLIAIFALTKCLTNLAFGWKSCDLDRYLEKTVYN
jgi:hypothetical protein